MTTDLSHIRHALPGKTLIFRNAACIITMNCIDRWEQESSSPVLLGVRKNSDLVVQDGAVAALGPRAAEAFLDAGEVEVINAHDLTLMPGLVDAHAHPIFAGSRANETVLKAQGLSYEEIAKRGGGIASTMRATRACTREALSAIFVRNAQVALARGVTLLEAKTGYGLSPAEEQRMLECIYQACTGGLAMPQIAPTLLAPHAASPEYHGLDAYIQAVIDHLPQYAAVAHAHEATTSCLPLAADIFVERGYFTPEHGDRWLNAALQHGIDVHIHADEFSRSGGSSLAVALAQRLEQTANRRRARGRVLSVSHCQYATESDLGRLTSHGVTAIVLPATSFFSNIPFVEARKWRIPGLRVAVASDFNPGSAPMNNLWFAAYLALTRCGFSLPEVLSGVTVHAAYALGAEKFQGEIAVGRPANIVAFEGHSPEDFFASPLGDHVAFVVRGGSSR